jgi:YHS domain-containing protein
MNWLAQNWYWAVLAVGFIGYWLLWSGRRRADAFGHTRHRMLAGSPHLDDGAFTSGDEERGQPGYRPGSSAMPWAAIDPVSGMAVQISDAITSVYQGRIFHFVSRANRDRFEEAPERYVSGRGSMSASAQQQAAPVHQRHGHGC